MKTKISKFVTVGALCGTLFHAGVSMGQQIPPRGMRAPVVVETEAQRAEREREREREARGRGEGGPIDPEQAVRAYVSGGRVPGGPSGNPYRPIPIGRTHQFRPAAGAAQSALPPVEVTPAEPPVEPVQGPESRLIRSERALFDSIRSLQDQVSRTPPGPNRDSLSKQLEDARELYHKIEASANSRQK